MSLQAIAVACYYSAPMAWNCSAVDSYGWIRVRYHGEGMGLTSNLSTSIFVDFIVSNKRNNNTHDQAVIRCHALLAAPAHVRTFRFREPQAKTATSRSINQNAAIVPIT